MKKLYDIGKRMVELEQTNRESIFNTLIQNPGITRKETAQRLGFDEGTVGRHVRAIRAGWRPQVKATASNRE